MLYSLSCAAAQEPLQEAAQPAEQPAQSAEQPAPSPVYQPFSQDSTIAGSKILEKLHNHPDCPTAVWASMCSDGTCCLLEMPRWPSDGPKAFRYRCSTCWNPNLPGESDLQGRPAAVNQMNQAWKHLAGCTTGHMSQHLFKNPISNDTKLSRVASVLPKLDDILLMKASQPQRTSKTYFTAEDLQSVRDSLRAAHSTTEKALADGAPLDPSDQEVIDALYVQVFQYGMAGNASRRKNKTKAPASGKVNSSAPTAAHGHQNMPPTQHPAATVHNSTVTQQFSPTGFNFDANTQNSMPGCHFSSTGPSASPVLLNHQNVGGPPPPVGNFPPPVAQLMQMYQGTQAMSTDFHAHSKPKS